MITVQQALDYLTTVEDKSRPLMLAHQHNEDGFSWRDIHHLDFIEDCNGWVTIQHERMAEE